MRLYVLIRPSERELEPYVLGELYAGPDEIETRGLGLAGQLAGPSAGVFTREELGQTAAETLTAWERRDDRAAVRARETPAEIDVLAGALPRTDDMPRLVESPPPLPAPAEPVVAISSDFFDLLQRWDDFMVAAGRADRTRAQYRRTLVGFAADTMRDPLGVSEEEVVAHLASLPARGHGRHHLLRALRAFYGWALARQLTSENPVALLPTPRPRLGPPEALTADEFTRLLLAAAWRQPKWAWTFLLMLETGARVGSIVGLQPEDVTTEPGRIIRFRVAKGDRPYAVPASPHAAEACRELLKLHRPGWRSLVGAGHPNTIWTWYRDSARAAGIPAGPKRRLHVLRHTFATNLLRRGIDVRTAQELLHHADLSQIPRYAAVTDPRKIAAVSVPSFDGLDDDQA